MASTRARSVRLPAARALAAVLLLVGAICAAAAADKPKVVVIGFDGADPKLVAQYRARGLMPNLDRIAREGTFSPLMPTNPPQTPVSWSSFATGLNPGRTEIFDFLQRERGVYQPDFALVTRGKTEVLFGERNGLAIGGVLGLVAGLIVLLVLTGLRRGWALAGGAATLAVAVTTAVLAGPIGRLLPVEMPAGTNNRKGTPFWTIAARSGMKVRITHVPVTFPAETLPAGSTMLSGLGVPDMRGRVGTPTFFTSDPNFTTGKNNEFSLELVRLPARRGAVEANVIGPYNYPFHTYVLERAQERWKAEGLSAAERREKEKELAAQLEQDGAPRRIDLPLRLEIGDTSAKWEISGQSGTLAPGEWSDWVVLDFPVNALVDWLNPLRGMGRFKLIALEPEVQLYLSPVNFHPSCHPVAYSFPAGWAEELAGQIGLFKTIGWTIDTWSYPSGVGGIDLFLEDMWATAAASDKIMVRSLTEPGADMVVQIYDFTDRAGHMLWHELDPGNPLFKPELEAKYRKAMEDTYRKMDAVIGHAHELAGPDALFLVLSDHGFSSFRRQINYNTWLYRNKLLVLKGQVVTRDLEQLFDRDVSNVDVFQGIDWSATRAWAMGLGSIYINLVGREPNGIVMAGDEYEQVVRTIKEGLEAEVDPVTGLKPVHRVYRRDELYHGFDPNKLPDLRTANIENYRVSWQDTLGGLSTQVFEDNDRVWSGDHCSLDPQFVRGILLVNRRLTVSDPGVMDMAPSILNELGLAPAEAPDGRIVWEPRR